MTINLQSYEPLSLCIHERPIRFGCAQCISENNETLTLRDTIEELKKKIENLEESIRCISERISDIEIRPLAYNIPYRCLFCDGQGFIRISMASSADISPCDKCEGKGFFYKK